MSPRRRTNAATADPQRKEKIRFSFEFYDNHDVYCLSLWNGDDIKRALQRLQQLNKLTILELLQQSRQWRFHPVDWAKTKERNGFNNISISDQEAYQ